MNENVGPDQTVQPLDWMGPSVHAMLLAETRLATRFMYDYHFYHHISSSPVRHLREIFIAELQFAKPDFVIVAQERFKSSVRGFDTSDHFDALEEFLDQYYELIQEEDAYHILARIDRRETLQSTSI